MARCTTERRLRWLNGLDRYPRRPMDTPTPYAPTDASGRGVRRRRRMRLIVVLVVFLLVTGAVSAAVAKYRGCQQPPPATGGAVVFPIPPGATGKDVVAALDQQGLIRCGGFVGNLLLRGTGKAGKILAGTYDLRVGMSFLPGFYPTRSWAPMSDMFTPGEAATSGGRRAAGWAGR